MFDKANEDSNTITQVYLTQKYFNYLRNSTQAKLLTATFENQVITNIAYLPVPSRAAFLEALGDEFGATFHIVDSVFKVENANGTTTSVRPWTEANIIGTPAEVVGRLVYGTLAEETNPVANVAYQKSGSHILLSKYSKTDPLEEFSAGQSLCLPVIDGADSIYMLTANDVTAGALDVENDDMTGYTLSVAKTASTNTFNIVYKGDINVLEATTDESWLTVSRKNNVLTVKVAANSASSAPAREGDVVLTDGYNTVTITISQAANS